MSKLVTTLIILLATIPLILFLFFGETKEASAPLSAPVIPVETKSQEPKPGDSPQCAMCRQINGSQSQAQCLEDFQCS